MFKRRQCCLSAGLLLVCLALAALPRGSAEDVALKPTVSKATSVAPAVHQALVSIGTTAPPTAKSSPPAHTTIAAKVAIIAPAGTTAAAGHLSHIKVVPSSSTASPHPPPPPPPPAGHPAPGDHPPPTLPPPASAAVTTVAPLGENKVAANLNSFTTIPPHELAIAKAMTVDEKIEQYFLPVCESVDRLKPKQFFKIQSELKQFVVKTAGKMSVCFMKQFGLDPNLTPITNAQLSAVCATRKSLDAKNTFKAFRECANHNWDPNLDKELERIIAARLNCAKNHDHSKIDTASSPLAHDSNNIADDESSFISEVVNKVFDEAKAVVSKSDIQLIDLSKPAAIVHATTKPVVAAVVPPVVVAHNGSAAAATVAPVALLAAGSTHAPVSHKAATIENSANKKLLNDPNTVVVFVDESSQKATTLAPVVSVAVAPAVAAAAAGSPTKPAVVVAATNKVAEPAVSAAVSVVTTAKPVVIKIEPPAAAKSATSAAPVVIKVAASTAAPVVNASALATANISAPVKVAINAVSGGASTAKPVVLIVSTTAPVVVTNSTAKPATVTTTVVVDATTKKPDSHTAASSTGEPESTSKPDAESHKTTSKPGLLTSLLAAISTQAPKEAADKATTTTGKPEPEAKGKISTQKPGRASDARMHQIEHERQMAIDPIGHTIKHQQYEAAKQQKNAKKAKE